ncbi:hypothetical protein [Ferruginibacter sp. SUN106]|uniref:hypothetical protein n=1 Tax=Ferruginibacter sp. SUN106 TaxID=2978348 RepID=UPI003D3653AA
MKKIIFATLLLATAFTVKAQEKEKDEKTSGFKKENFFTGGSLTASFFSGGTALGVSPYFGYSLNRFIDVAASVNLNYTTQRDYNVYGDKVRQTVYGPGAFVRLYPVKFLFAQAQYEHNFIKFKYIPLSNSGYTGTTSKIDANSMLVGGGFASGRQDVGDVYYYFSVLWDISKVAESPYIDGLGRNFPVVRAGLQIPLFQGEKDRGYSSRNRRY